MTPRRASLAALLALVPVFAFAQANLPPDADPWHEIFERVPPVIARWLNTFPGETLLFVAHGGVFWALQHLCRSPFTPLANCRPAHVAPVGETSWRIEMLTAAQTSQT